MPELPEVETIVSDLKPVLTGRFFVDLIGTHENSILGALDNVATIRDQKVVEVARRGKFINIFFENDYVMTIHLRMSGRIISRDTNDEALRFERTRIDFNGVSLRFCDVRKFGKVWIAKATEYEAVTGISRLGVEPLNGDLNLNGFIKMMNGKKGVVKKWLLDQSLVAGVGNIYADEGCFYARIRPDHKMENLKEKDLESLFEGVIKALKQGVKNRGTSISDFQDAYGHEGKNQELLYVYGRGGEKCMKCERTLKRTVVAGRGTVYCESCQK
jgi:formamidopyrimidine-DNA glycosylase